VITLFVYIRYWGGGLEYNETVHQLFIDFKRTYDSVGMEVLYNILTEFEVPMKLFRLIKICLNETYNKVCITKYLSDKFPVQNVLKQGDALPPFHFNFALGYSIKEFQENWVGLKLNGTHHPLVHADDVIILEANINTIKKNTETLVDASKEVGLEVNAEKAKNMLMFRYQDTGQNYNIKVPNRSFQNVTQLKYLGTTVTNKNLIQEEIRRRLNSGKACYHCLLICCIET
jgi:hypothetical protein